MTIMNRKLKGSITVEAAFSFTITVFVLFLMIGPLLIIKTTSDFIIELNEASKIRCNYETLKYTSSDTRIYRDIKEYFDEHSVPTDDASSIENIVNYTSILFDFSRKYDDSKSEYRNINFVYDLNPDTFDKENHTVKYDYLVNYSLPYNILNVEEVNNRLVNFRRAFVGADENRFDSEYEDGEYIYVANNYVNSSVYHTNINCTYLVKKTTSFEYKNLSNYRNYNNKKYTKCDYCFRGIGIINTTKCYITQYGDKFHYKSDCPLMTAYVTKIPKDSIDGYNLRPCFKCAKEEERE